MRAMKFVICGALIALSTLAFFKLESSSAWAGRGCRPGQDCNYSSSGAATTANKGGVVKPKTKNHN